MIARRRRAAHKDAPRLLCTVVENTTSGSSSVYDLLYGNANHPWSPGDEPGKKRTSRGAGNHPGAEVRYCLPHQTRQHQNGTQQLPGTRGECAAQWFEPGRNTWKCWDTSCAMHTIIHTTNTAHVSCALKLSMLRRNQQMACSRTNCACDLHRCQSLPTTPHCNNQVHEHSMATPLLCKKVSCRHGCCAQSECAANPT